MPRHALAQHVETSEAGDATVNLTGAMVEAAQRFQVFRRDLVVMAACLEDDEFTEIVGRLAEIHRLAEDRAAVVLDGIDKQVRQRNRRH